MNAVAAVEAGPDRASFQHPDAEVFDLCGVMTGLATTWKRLHDLVAGSGPFTPADAAFRAFSEYVWPGYHAPDRQDLVAWLARVVPRTEEGRRARARAVLALHRATEVTESGHAAQHDLVATVLAEAAGTGPA